MPLVGELYQMVKLTYQLDFPDRELSAASELQHYLWREPSARQPYSSRGFRPIPGCCRGYIEGEGCGEPGELQGLGALHVSDVLVTISTAAQHSARRNVPPSREISISEGETRPNDTDQRDRR